MKEATRRIKHKTLLAFIVFIILGGLLLNGFQADVLAKEKVFKWTYICPMPWEAVPWTLRFAKDIEKASKGRLQIVKLQGGEHPYAFADFLPAVRDRKVEMATVAPTMITGIEPIMGLYNQPFLLNDPKEALALANAPEFQDVFNKVWTEPLAKWKQRQIVIDYTPSQGLAGNVFLDSMDALKGKKIMALTPEQQAMIAVFGGTATPLPMGELYSALKTGVIDGALDPITVFYNLHLFEVCTHFTEFFFSIDPVAINVNLDAWNELPKDLQDTILKTLADSEARWQEEEGRRCAELRQKVAKEYNIKVKVMDRAFFAKAREHMKSIWASWVKRTGPEAQHLIDRVEVFQMKHKGQ